MQFLRYFLLFFILKCTKSQSPDQFSLKIIHINDFHSRYEEINTLATKCKPETETCLGGYARTVSAVKSLKAEMENSIFVNAGDNFQGTLWYDHFKGNATSFFLNLLPADAITLGNHEFDDGIEGLLPFMRNIESPVVVCNIDDDGLEPTLKGLYEKSVVLERGGKKIGVIGVIIADTPNLSRPGKVQFFNEIESIRSEIAKLKAQQVDIIVLLSHCGLTIDREIAKTIGEDIHVIVGGHSHSLLYTGPSPSPDAPVDVYPIEVSHNDGKKTLIVQALAFSKFVGNLTVHFDQGNKILSYEGNPVYMDEKIAKDETILREMLPYEKIISEIGNEQVAFSKIPLEKGVCSTGECSYGNLINDAYVDYYVSANTDPSRWTLASIALSNAGIIRVGLNRGNITFDDLATSHPYENTVDTFDLRGDHLLEALEISAAKHNTTNFLQLSGLKLTIDITAPKGERIKSAKARCDKCRIPVYETLDPQKYYRIAIASWIGDGGNGYQVFKDHRKNVARGPTSLSVVHRYMKKISPIVGTLDGRIQILN
ncbi:apyrase-like [Culicoides brevitarsis]|uniref:apyrase-like n=1 Tax=Culicoides brevitarsis TaxID=469753 RepID=UPI00307C76C0